jgi:cobalt-zinc-cadmium efflux system outer membrane protein
MAHVALLLLTAPPGASAQVPATGAAPAPPVDALVARAVSRAPSLSARRERIQAARAAVRASDALPEPMIEFQYQAFNFPRYTIGSDPSSMAGASIRQSLVSGGQRTTRRASADAEINRRAAEQRMLVADIATEVRTQYARLYAIDRERDTLTDASQLVRMLEATVSARYAAGQTDQANLLRVQLEQSRIGQRVADLLAERVGVAAALNRLTNDPPDAPVGRVADLPARVPAPTASIIDQVAQNAPAIALRNTELDLAHRQVDAARQELKPAWTVGGGVYWQGGFDRMVNFTVGVELPVWKTRKQLPLIAAAEHEQRAAQLELANATIEVRAEATRLLAEWQNAVDQIERYQNAILPQSNAALDATRASYLGGRVDFVSVLDEFRRWIAVRIEIAGREADRFVAQSRLTAILGASGQGPLQ